MPVTCRARPAVDEGPPCSLHLAAWLLPFSGCTGMTGPFTVPSAFLKDVPSRALLPFPLTSVRQTPQNVGCKACSLSKAAQSPPPGALQQHFPQPLSSSYVCSMHTGCTYGRLPLISQSSWRWEYFCHPQNFYDPQGSALNVEATPFLFVEGRKVCFLVERGWSQFLTEAHLAE